MNNTFLNALIVDDEPLARQLMRMQLTKVSSLIQVAEAPSAALALSWLEKNACDVIFLDIHMPDITGLEFAQQLRVVSHKSTPPAIIFVTADSRHALQAFDLAALDYLTKPVSPERLEKALQRVADQMTLKKSPVTQGEEPYLTIESHQQISQIPISQILYFHADSKYTHVITSKQSYLSEEPLNTLELRFEPHVIRTHRAYLVVISAIEKLIKEHSADADQDRWVVQLYHSKELLPISRRQLAAVKKLLQNAA